MSDLNLHTTEVDASGIVRVTLEGSLDLGSVGELETVLDAAPADADVLIDARGVTFIDSSGLALLLDRTARARAAGRSLELVAGPPVLAVLELAQVAEELDLVDE